MKNPRRKVFRAIAVAAAASMALALSACGSLIVDNPGGVGTCGGKVVTIAVSQTIPGAPLNVSYTGPADVSLFLMLGIYSDGGLGSLGLTPDDRILGFGDADEDVRIYKLPFAGPDWTAVGSGDSTTYSYSGSVADFYRSATTDFSVIGTLAEVIPTVVGVDCNPNDGSQNLVAPTTSLFTAAAGIAPNTANIDPLAVMSQTVSPSGDQVTGVLRFPSGAETNFATFVPTTESIIGVSLEAAEPTYLGMGGIAWLLLNRGPQPVTLSVTGTLAFGKDLPFTLTKTGGGSIPEGNYFVYLAMTDNAGDIGFARSSMTYSAASGLTLADTRTVTYNGNTDDSGAPPQSQTIVVGDSGLTLPGSGTLHKTGYTFKGWAESAGDANGVGATPLTGSYAPTASVTLNAVWEADVYRVTYDANMTDVVAPASEDFTYGDPVLTLAPVGSMAKDGFAFRGWSESAGVDGAGGVAVSDSYSPTASITLYAMWIPQYVVTYDANNGDGAASEATQAFAIGDDALTFPTVGSLAKTGYSFMGWAESAGDANGVGETPLTGSYTPTASTTLYAVWVADPPVVVADPPAVAADPHAVIAAALSQTNGAYGPTLAIGFIALLFGTVALGVGRRRRFSGTRQSR